MNRKKYKIGISALLICAMLGTVSLPIWAEEASAPASNSTQSPDETENPNPQAEPNTGGSTGIIGCGSIGGSAGGGGGIGGGSTGGGNIGGENTGDENTPQPLEITVNANYYTTETDGEYHIIFTTFSDITPFTELGFKVSLTAATVDEAGFETRLLGEGDAEDIIRGRDYATYKLTRQTANGVAQKTAFATLTIAATEVPAAENLSFSDFYLVNAEGATVTVTPTVTFQAGPIIPDLNEDEQEVYDLITALPEANALSYYDGDALASLSDLNAQLEEAQTAYSALGATSKENVDKVLAYNNYTTDVFEELDGVLDIMDRAKGLVELAYAVKAATSENILEYQCLLTVYAAVKPDIDTTGLPAEAVAAQEIAAIDTLIESANALLTTALASADLEDKAYACGDQLQNVQAMSGHMYYDKYLDDIAAQIEAVTTDINDNYTGREENKQNLLTHLNSYKSTVDLIKKGVTDIPTMYLKEIIRSQSFTIAFNRAKTLDASINASIRVVVTNEAGTQIDQTEKTFPANAIKLDVSMLAMPNTYLHNEVVTINAYYVLNGASFLIDSQNFRCATVGTQLGGIGNGNSNVNTLPGAGGTSNGGSSSVGGSASGGTIFPSDETIQPEDNVASPTQIFTDIDNYGWAKEAIEGLYYAGIINGMEEGIYNPAGLVTREQFSKMVVQLFGVATGSTETNFVDVKEDAWHAPYIAAALQAGYIQGQSDEYFGVGESIMRQDMATILYRALGDQNSKAVLSFSDVDDIAPYAEDAIAELVGLGVLNGYEDGTFKPRGTATRAEAAKTIWGIYQILQN